MEIEKRYTFSRTIGRGRQQTFVRPNDILYCKADNKYVDVFTTDGEQHTTETSITYFEKQLGDRMIRIHRNCLVAKESINSIVKVRTETTITSVIKLSDGSEHVVSRRNVPAIKKLFKNLLPH